MPEAKILPSVNDILSMIMPLHLAIIFFVILITTVAITLVILFHLKKYREYNPLTIPAQVIYITGVIALLSFAFIFLLFSI